MDWLRRWVIPGLVFCLYRLLSWTWRVTLEEPPTLQENLKRSIPVALAHWHGDELVLLSLIGYYRIATIISTSKDGEIMNQLVRWQGGTSSRGSSTRGGISALKGLIRLMRTGKHNTSFAVDGPKGPIYKVKAGVFEVSRIVPAPIYWAGVWCDRAWHFEKSWNKTYLPKPFAKVKIQWFGPMAPLSASDDPHDEKLALQLEESLNAAKHQLIIEKQN